MYAYRWIRNHLEEHTDTCLPKQSVYDAYRWVNGVVVCGLAGIGLPPHLWRAPCLDRVWHLKGFPRPDARDPPNLTMTSFSECLPTLHSPQPFTQEVL